MDTNGIDCREVGKMDTVFPVFAGCSGVGVLYIVFAGCGCVGRLSIVCLQAVVGWNIVHCACRL